jgi:acyl-CoA thioester hydrolase
VTDFRFSHPIEVRYADLDPQRHVNNVTLFSYLEQSRARYFQHLGLWNGEDFDDIGIIIAEASASFKAPIPYQARVIVSLGVSRLGVKSFDIDYVVHDGEGKVFATGRTVVVAYDYLHSASRPIPSTWRHILAEYEGLDETPVPRRPNPGEPDAS